jgi:two-component system, cell cycle response regulator DivK
VSTDASRNGRGILAPRWTPCVPGEVERRVDSPTVAPTVLLVEDDRDGRRLYAQWLRDAGLQVAEAHNGLQALERALELCPDVVVTDLNIPGIDGFELTRRLRQDARVAHVPVLAITGYAAFASDPARAHRAGCDAVLPKPCTQEDFEAAIRALLPRRQDPVPR